MVPGSEWANTLNLDNVNSQDLVTSTRDEEFHLASTLSNREVSKHSSTNEMFIGEDISFCRIAPYISHLAGVVHALMSLLMTVMRGATWTCFITA